MNKDAKIRMLLAIVVALLVGLLIGVKVGERQTKEALSFAGLEKSAYTNSQYIPLEKKEQMGTNNAQATTSSSTEELTN